MTQQTTSLFDEIEYETVFGDTVGDMFKSYLERPMPSVIPKGVTIGVSEDAHDELQHIRQGINKSYSLGIPTSSLPVNEIPNDEIQNLIDIKRIENRHKDILNNVIDAFIVSDYSSDKKSDKTVSDSEHAETVDRVAKLFSRIPGVTVTIPDQTILKKTDECLPENILNSVSLFIHRYRCGELSKEVLLNTLSMITGVEAIPLGDTGYSYEIKHNGQRIAFVELF